MTNEADLWDLSDLAVSRRFSTGKSHKAYTT
jgi:hypothetical protein